LKVPPSLGAPEALVAEVLVPVEDEQPEIITKTATSKIAKEDDF
jgi:hypothetical protein